MNPDALEQRLRQLAETVKCSSSVAQDVMRRIEQTSIAPARPTRFRGYRIMQAKTLKWLIPAVIAAAVVVAVGIWPHGERTGNGGGSGRVYGMTDAVDLLRNARIAHVKGWLHVPTIVAPGQQQTKTEIEMWHEPSGSRWRATRPQTSTTEDETTVAHCESVSDGEYEMQVNHTLKTVRFERLTPFQCMLESRRTFDTLLKQLFGDPRFLSSYRLVGNEKIEGRSFAVWEGEITEFDLGLSLRCRCWLDPASGDVGRLHAWFKQPKISQDWVPVVEMATIERLANAPADTFVTNPPAGYKLENTKASASYRELHFEGGIGLGDLHYSAFISFVLEDGSLILGWSSIDQAASTAQDDLFKDLAWGGPLPKLPIEIYGFEQQDGSQKITYSGRHLAYTRKGGQFVEWSIYVPDKPLPAGGLSRYYRALHRFNVPKDKVQGTMVANVSQPFSFESHEFDALVRGAMAEFSDDGVVPKDVTYERVMKLSQQIRESLK